jgi:hypothetical protein
MVAGAVVSIALAMALTRWYDEPLRAALSGRRFRRTPSPAASP